MTPAAEGFIQDCKVVFKPAFLRFDKAEENETTQEKAQRVFHDIMKSLINVLIFVGLRIPEALIAFPIALVVRTAQVGVITGHRVCNSLKVDYETLKTIEKQRKAEEAARKKQAAEADKADHEQHARTLRKEVIPALAKQVAVATRAANEAVGTLVEHHRDNAFNPLVGRQ